MTKTEMLKKIRSDYSVYSVNILDLNIGDKVKIVDKWRFSYSIGFQDTGGRMDKYLGRTMTVSDFQATGAGRPCVRLEEDDGFWLWSSELIDSVEKEIQIKDLSILIEGL